MHFSDYMSLKSHFSREDFKLVVYPSAKDYVHISIGGGHASDSPSRHAMRALTAHWNPPLQSSRSATDIIMMMHDIIQLSMLGYFLSTQTTHLPRTWLWLHNTLSTLLIPMCILCAWDGISLVTDLANIETVAYFYLCIIPWSPSSWTYNTAPMFL